MKGSKRTNSPIEATCLSRFEDENSNGSDEKSAQSKIAYKRQFGLRYLLQIALRAIEIDFLRSALLVIYDKYIFKEDQG